MKDKKRIGVQMEIDQPYKRHVSVFAGVHKYAREKSDWHLVVDDWASRSILVQPDRPIPFDGIIGRLSSQDIVRAHRRQFPIVNVLFETDEKNTTGVYPDYAACGRLRAEHLLSRGFRNFGTLTSYHSPAHNIESSSFATTVRSEGYPCKGLYLEGPWTVMGDTESNYRRWKRVRKQIETWLDDWQVPMGLFIADVDIARVIIESCYDRGWNVPEDVAIVAGTNEEELCLHPEPSLTSLEIPYETIGYEAARLLDQLIHQSNKSANRRAKEPATKLFLAPTGVVARRSTDFFAIDNELIRQALRYIDVNLHRAVSIDDVANALLVSRRKLTSEFRRHLNRTVAGEVQRLRIERVKRELLSTELTVKEIAERSGFASLRTLNDAFVRVVGCAPRDYRNTALRSEDSS
ncbi:substrate-binding domain-containing protein [Bremerella sp. JC770]|uniref:substrate-binding domain-containing protein n=1 Tax=Bremerella sp. JC770 TaxID=3232137 RepID=UPI00345A82D3